MIHSEAKVENKPVAGHLRPKSGKMVLAPCRGGSTCVLASPVPDSMHKEARCYFFK